MKLEEKKELKVDDITLNYYEKGTGDSIIFIHGNGMKSDVFSKIYNYYSKNYNVIAIDSRGQGLSSTGNKIYSLELFADDIIEFCKKKSLNNVIIIGHSDGANIALHIAKKSPKLIKKMILVSGNYTVEGIHRWFRLVLKIYRGLWSVRGTNKILVKKKLELIDLMLKDMNITDEDLKNINTETLVLCADIDVICKNHTISIHENIKNSILKTIRFANHLSIINKKQAMIEIDKFLLNDSYI